MISMMILIGSINSYIYLMITQIMATLLLSNWEIFCGK